MAACKARWAVALLGIAILLWSRSRDRPAPVPIGRGLGQPVASFALREPTTGKFVALSDFRGKRAVVVVFTGIDCPIGNLYIPRLSELAGIYEKQGVTFLAINSNAHETADEVAAHARSLGVVYPVLKDQDNVVADQLEAERTCEVLVIDGRGRLRYRGAIDDQYALGTRKVAPARAYLVDALEAVLAGRPVTVPETPVIGCFIDRVEPKPVSKARPRVRPAAAQIVSALADTAAPDLDVGHVTFAADVAAILQNRCQACHRPGQVGPFSLLNYDQARRWSASIREVVEDGRMPPWHADPRYGRFSNDRRLTARERAILLAWVDQGSVLGDPSALPAPRTFPQGWSIGTPDAIFEMPQLYTVKAEGVLPYQHFRVPTRFSVDKWVQAAEVRPGDRSVIHHIFIRVDQHNSDPFNGRLMEPYFVGYVPGDMPSVFPLGTAKRIPAGSDLTFEVHYTPNGRVRVDRTSVGLIFAKKPPEHRVRTKGIKNEGFVIPPGAANHAVASTYTFTRNSLLLSFVPHMHVRGKDFLYTATYPDGRAEILLWVPAYDFGWQSVYRLVEPKAMPKGTRIDCLAHFDNSSNNPANPDPAQSVRWGEQTYDEMMVGYIDYCENE